MTRSSSGQSYKGGRRSGCALPDCLSLILYEIGVGDTDEYLETRRTRTHMNVDEYICKIRETRKRSEPLMRRLTSYYNYIEVTIFRNTSL